MSKPKNASQGEALFLAPEAPYPVAGGGALRSASLLEYLARRYEVDVVVFREPGAPDPRPHFPPGIAREIRILKLPANGRSIAARALRNASRMVRRVPPLIDRFSGFGGAIAQHLAGRHYTLAVVEHFWCAPYWEHVAPAAARTVLDLHNVESVLHERCARAGGVHERVAHGVFARACRALERTWLPRYSLLLAASKEDATALGRIAPKARIAVYPNALPPIPRPLCEQEDVVVFSGNLGYHPNISAVRFFRRRVWPLLRDRHPGLRWRLVGKNPQGVFAFTAGDPRIEVTGPVADALAEIARAKVAVVPLLAASGTRLKILEAWAAGVAVVSTPVGAEGLPARHGENILLAADAAGFADAVARLLDDAELRLELGNAGRRLFENEFTWDAVWSRLDL